LEQRLLALAADHDWWMRLRQRLRIADRVDDFVMAAVETGLLLREHALDDLERFIQRLQAARNRFEIDPEAPMLQLKPSRADSEIEPPARDVVERRRHLRGDTRVAIGVAIDERSQARSLGVLAEGGKQRPPFHAGAGRVRNKDRIEMVEDPERVVAPFVGLAPQLDEL